MSVLLVEIGNTALKWAELRDGQVGPISYRRHSEEAPSRWFDTLWRDQARPAAVCLASVATQAFTRTLVAWIEAHWELQPEWLQSEPQAFGVTNGYANPAQLGVDRWLAMVGAWSRVGRACCVVDCGTAATVDAVDASGRHLGGFILPGIGTARRALLQQTRIPRVEDVTSPAEFGTDTASAVAIGARLAVLGAIEHALRALAAGDGEPTLFLAGSEAELLLPRLTTPHVLAPALVLEGMACYAAERC